MNVPIKRSIERVPGGMMIVPLLVAAAITTVAPGTPNFFGSFTGFFLFFADKLTGGTGVGALVAQATLLVTTSVVVTAICVPFVTAWWASRVRRRGEHAPSVGTEYRPRTGHGRR